MKMKIKMKDLFDQKRHEERLKGAKVGKVLLKDEYGKTGPEIIEKEYQLLSVMETFERKFEYKSILKAFETTLNQKNRLILSGFDSNRQNNISDVPNKLLLTKIPKQRSASAIKIYSNNINNIKNNKRINTTKKMRKTLSYDNFPIFKGKSYLEKKNIFPFLFHSNKNKDLKIKSKNQKVIRFPSNIDNINFTNSINLRMDILKKNEKENKIKKYLILKSLDNNGNKEIKNANKNGNDSYGNNDDDDGEEDVHKDPFKEIRNKFDYSKIMENLKEKYKFYPFSYLEEHKNIDPNKFRFMIDNFNSKFSLFGKNNNILNSVNKKFRKKIVFLNNNRASEKIMAKILRNKNKENL